MYEVFFGFSQRPFLSVPRTDRYYPGDAIEQARQNLTRCIDRAEGCGMIVGPVGTGKTLLCQVLAEHFQDRLEPVFLSSVRLTTRKDLLQAILYELGSSYRRMQEGELRLSLIDRLAPSESRPDGMLLLVDEAHSLSLRLFDELRMLTNLTRGGSQRVRLVMAGGPVLEERFAHPRLESFNQRLVARCYLESFSSAETTEYVRAQTAVAGVDPDQVWSQPALRAVYQATDGCPRLINQVCDHALVLASSAQQQVIDDRIVEEAWADLQQLPTPWNGDADNATSPDGSADPSTVIEFGNLLDDGEEGFAREATDAVHAAGKPTEPVDDRVDARLAAASDQDDGGDELDELLASDEHSETVGPESPAAEAAPAAESIEFGEAESPEAESPEAEFTEAEFTEAEFTEPEFTEPETPEAETPEAETVGEIGDERNVIGFQEQQQLNPEQQLNDLEYHLADAQATFADSDERTHVELVFDDDNVDQQDDSQTQIVIDDFDGLTGDNVVHLSPAAEPIVASDDDLEHTDDDEGSGDDEGFVVEPADGQWQVMMDESVSAFEAPEDSESQVPPSVPETRGEEGVRQQEMDRDGIEHEQPPEVSTPPSASCAAEQAEREDAASDLSWCHLSQSSRPADQDAQIVFAPSYEVQVASDVAAESALDFQQQHDHDESGAGLLADDGSATVDAYHHEVEASTEQEDAAVGLGRQATETEVAAQQHPTIPVRQREYRQLFAMLYDESQRPEAPA